METVENKARVVVKISGRVQGVYFRKYTELEAQQLGLTGWVRNLPDGRVEAVFEGRKESIQKMIEWCHKGPPAARVQDVSVSWEPFRGDFFDFRTVHSF